ncbi:hypothetical protein MYX65_05600 [Acidobacteria bacterium AH-259-L09]|nr:hypothetical protein [Acidobacteria bacterium AH-259-L09]
MADLNKFDANEEFLLFLKFLIDKLNEGSNICFESVISRKLKYTRRGFFLTEDDFEEEKKIRKQGQIDLGSHYKGSYLDYLDTRFEIKELKKLFDYCRAKDINPRLDFLKKILRRKNDRLLSRVQTAWPRAMDELSFSQFHPSRELSTPQASASKKKARKKKPGPKGPRKASCNRRTAIKLLKQEGFSGLEACKRLKDMNIPLPSKRLQTLYGKCDWVHWFHNEPKAFYKQWSADLKRPSF